MEKIVQEKLDQIDLDMEGKVKKVAFEQVKELFEHNKRFNPAIDVGAALTLIKAGFTERETGRIIAKFSPVIKELGIHGEAAVSGFYFRDIMKKRSNDIMADYKNWKENIINRQGYRHGAADDVEIAQVLFVKDYERHQIHQAINQLSPETAGKNPIEAIKYAQEVTQKALTPVIKQQILNISQENSLKR